MSEEKFDQFKSLFSDDLAAAYDILYGVHTLTTRAFSPPMHVKASRVIEVLSGDVAPGCYAKEWFLFFEHLNGCLENRRAETKEPERPELKPGDRVQLGRRSNITGRVVDAPDNEGNCMVRWDRTGSVEEESIRDLELIKTEEQ